MIEGINRAVAFDTIKELVASCGLPYSTVASNIEHARPIAGVLYHKGDRDAVMREFERKLFMRHTFTPYAPGWYCWRRIYYSQALFYAIDLGNAVALMAKAECTIFIDGEAHRLTPDQKLIWHTRINCAAC